MIKKFLLLFISLICTTSSLHAQVDVVLSGLISSYTEKAEKQFKAQNTALALQSTGHIWTNEEVKGTNLALTTYREYLDSFRDVIVYAGQTYGFYIEVSRLLNNMSELSKGISAHAEGAFATALSRQKSKILRKVVLSSMDVVNDIRKICVDKHKMTEKERIKLVFAIRPKLREMNKLLTRLTLSVKYSSMNEVLLEVGFNRPKVRSKKEIADECFKRWTLKHRTVTGK